MSKIWKPTDFPKPTPDALRSNLADLVDKQLSQNGGSISFENNKVKVECSISFRSLTQDELIDFESWYARQGGWKTVSGIKKASLEPIDSIYRFTFTN